MILPLLRKELRALVPVLLLLVTLFGFELLYAPLLSPLDTRDWASHAGVLPGEGTALGIIIIVLGLLVAYSLFPREHDERTIEFLYSLPVTRGRIFLAKLLAAVLVLGAGFVVSQVTCFVLQVPNPQSFSGHQFRASAAVTGGLLHLALGVIVVCHGIPLSFFRRFGVVLYCMAAWAVILLVRLDPAAGFLDPTKIVGMEYEGTRLVVPWSALAFHGVVALVSLGVGFLLWMGAAERLAVGFARGLEGPAGKLALGCGTASIIVLVFALLMYLAFTTHDPEDAAPVRYATFQTARAETTHYRFTYGSDVRARALRLIGRADDAYARVREALGAQDGKPIVVDLTERSGDHSGIAVWQKIRMDVASQEDEEELLLTFMHETTHALALQVSERRLFDNAGVCRAFSEGLAEHVSLRLLGDAERLERSRRHAVAACTRQDLPFEVLVDDDALRVRHDPNLAYPVGETWCEALVRCYGLEAPGAVLRSMARDDAPRDLDALAFWQDTLLAAGFDLERVNTEWHALLDELEREHADFLASVPRVSGGVTSANDLTVLLVATLEGDAPRATVVARARENAQTKDEDTLNLAGSADPADPRRWSFSLPRGAIRGRRFELQLGVQLDGTGLPIFEPWQAAALPR